MTDAQRAALRQGLATAGAALGVGILQLHQPFLAVLAAQLIAGHHCPAPGGWAKRLLAACGGSTAGIIILSGLPQQPWLSWPAFGTAAAFGCFLISQRWEPACVILFGMGICSSFPAGVIYPVPALAAGIEHAGSLTIAIAACWLARSLAGEAAKIPAAARPLPSGSAVAIGTTVIFSLIAAGLFLPHELVVITVASAATIIALETPGASSHIPARSAGAAGGIALSVAAIILISGSGNNLAFFLLALGLSMAALDGFAVMFPHAENAFRQAGAVFAVMVTTFPQPDQTLVGSANRAAAVMIGLSVAAAIHTATSRKLDEKTNPMR